MCTYLIGFGDVSPATALQILPANGELCWHFLKEERMKQYSRDKNFPQLRTKVINLVGEPHRTSLVEPPHTKANTCTQRKQEVVNPLGGYLQGLNLVVVDR